jgi:tetratricopeptide repeat protein 8
VRQYDMALTCFERALHLASDDALGDIWFNIGHVGVSIGDLNLAYQSLKIAISIDPHHAEALNNLAVLELKKGNVDLARAAYQSAQSAGPHAFESFYNGGM